MGNYNPSLPTILGNEFAPIADDPVAIDTASQFGYTFLTDALADVAIARVHTATPPPGNMLRKILSCEVYSTTDAPSTGPMRKATVAVSDGFPMTSSAALVNAVTWHEALRNPSDNSYVSLTGPTPPASFRVWFSTSSGSVQFYNALLGARIVDVTVKYVATGLFDDYVVPLRFALERPSTGTIFDMDTNITGAATAAESVVPRRSRLGDYNPFWNTTINPNTDMRRHRWEIANGSNGFCGLESLSASGGTNINLRVYASPDVPLGVEAFRIHYLALEVTYCGESRTASGALDLSAGASYGGSQEFYYDVPLMGLSSGLPWTSPAGQNYTAVIGQGYVGALSQTYPVPLTVNRLVPSRSTFRGYQGVEIRRTLRAGEEWTREDADSIPAITFFKTVNPGDDSLNVGYPPSQVYIAQTYSNADQTVAIGTRYQDLVDDVAGRTYTQVRFYARRYDRTADALRVSLSSQANTLYGPYAQITPEEFDLLPELANGWREVTLTLSAPWVSLGAGYVRLNLTAATDTEVPWEVLGADSNPSSFLPGAYGPFTYGGSLARMRSGTAVDIGADLSMVLVMAMPVPAGLAVTPAVQPLTAMDQFCGVGVPGIPTGIRYHQLSWTAVNDLSVAGFGHYEIQRRDTTMDAGVWETVAEITAVSVTDMDDYEARVGVVSTYRIRTVHEDGYTSAWSATAAATITAPGVTGERVDRSVLILTSNINPAGNLAYAMVWEGSTNPRQDFTFTEGGQTDYQEMYGRDYVVAFRPLERGGVSFTRNVLLNAAGVPAETLDRGAVALRDLAWATVPYVCTRDELSNRWLTALDVPSSATRDIPAGGHLVVAPVEFTEVTGTPAPVDYGQVCGGARLEGRDNFQYWTTPIPTALYGTRVKTDTFTRTVSNGWGTATTGGTWVSHGSGTLSDYQVTGAVGTIASPSVTVERGQVISGTVDYNRAMVQFTVNGVATGGTYSAGMLIRFQDVTNYYWAKVRFTTAGTFALDIERVAAGVRTTLVTGATVSTYTTGTVIRVEVLTRGTYITARVWKDATLAPDWDTTSNARAHVQSTPLAMTGRVGVLQIRDSANTNAALLLSYDNFSVDTIPEVYDLRVRVRPFNDVFDVSYAPNELNATDAEGGWALRVYQSGVEWYRYGVDFKTSRTAKVTELGLVKNRLTTLRVVNNGDDGTGASVTQFYTLAADGVTWTLVETVTDAAPVQPTSLQSAGTVMQVENYDPGGIWTETWELRLDGTVALSPNFAAQPPGTLTFADAQGNTWTGPAGRGICDFLD